MGCTLYMRISHVPIPTPPDGEPVPPIKDPAPGLPEHAPPADTPPGRTPAQPLPIHGRAKDMLGYWRGE